MRFDRRAPFAIFLIVAALMIGCRDESRGANAVTDPNADAAVATDAGTDAPTSDDEALPRIETAKIVFEVNQTLWTMNPDGSEVTQLPIGLGRAPRWSPDHETIAFSRGVAGDLVLVDANGANARTIATNTLPAKVWSPDGGRMIFERLRNPAEDATRVFVVNVDGTGETFFLPGAFPCCSPYTSPTAWSHDGTIAFLSCAGTADCDETTIWSIRSDRSNLGVASKLDGFSFVDISDESSLWLASDGGGGLVSYDPDTTATFQITTRGNHGCWSPDRAFVVYVAPEGIRTVDFWGNDDTLIYASADVDDVDW